MKLSMWILADELKPYQPICKIEEGSQILQNVRILSETSKMSDYTVYLSQLNEKHIVLLNKRDMLIIPFDDINQLLDVVLDVFEKYNEWSNSIYKDIQNNISGTELLKRFNWLTGFSYLITDMTWFVVDRFVAFNNPDFPEKYLSDLSKPILPINILRSLQKDPHIYSAMDTYKVSITEMNCDYIIANLFHARTQKGRLTAQSPVNFYSRGAIQIHNEMKKMTELWLDASQYSNEKLGTAGLIQDIFAHRHPDISIIAQRFSVISWNLNDPITLYLIQDDSENHTNSSPIDRHLQQTFPDSIVFRRSKHLLMLINNILTPNDYTEKTLSRFLTANSCYAGKSRTFYDIFQIEQHYEEAAAAVFYGNSNSGTINSVGDVLLSYTSAILKEYSKIDIIHPALTQLQKYDTKHQTELYITLKYFLQSGINYKKTAESLFIHRTTLMYRLERITDITHVDLTDYLTRLHLEISYLIKEVQQPV